MRCFTPAFVLSAAAAVSAADCNPTKASCPAIAGFTGPYSVDFSNNKALSSSDWIVAAYEDPFVKPSAQGLQFQLTNYTDAPNIWTSKYFLYGTVSVVMKSAPGKGVISSAVLMSDTLDEIDWEFSGNNFGKNVPTVQTNYYGKGIVGSYDRGTLPTVNGEMTTAFKNYTLVWKADSLTWMIDNKVVRTLKRSDTGDREHQYPQTPARFHLGAWDGGSPTSPDGTATWAGGRTDIHGFPYSSYVRSVSIIPDKHCAQYSYSDKSGSEGSVKCIASGGSGSSSCPTAPSPLLPNTAAHCDKYYRVKAGDTCSSISSSQGITTANLNKWNPSVNSDCTNLWANYYVCVSQPKTC